MKGAPLRLRARSAWKTSRWNRRGVNERSLGPVLSEEGLAGAHGNRTHQEPVSRPLTGFEDRAGHQPRTRPDSSDEASRRRNRFVQGDGIDLSLRDRVFMLQIRYRREVVVGREQNEA